MPSAADLITGSFRALNIIAADETPSGSMLTLGLSVLNRMVSRWRLKRLLIFHLQRSPFPLIANTKTYTIGPSGQFNVARPTWIDRAGVVLDRTIPVPIEVPLGRTISAADYADIAIKDLPSAYPSVVYYERAFTGAGLGRVHVWPVPTGTVSDLVLYLPNAMANFPDLATDILLPDGFEEAIHSNLAIRLAAEGFAAPVPDDLRKIAMGSLVDIQYASVDIPVVRFDRALVGRLHGRRDIRTNGY